MTHRRQGMSSFISHKGHVEVEGTKGNDIRVDVDLRTTSKDLADGVDVSVNGNEVVITVSISLFN